MKENEELRKCVQVQKVSFDGEVAEVKNQVSEEMKNWKEEKRAGEDRYER